MLVAAPAFVLLGALAVSETLDRACEDFRSDEVPAGGADGDGGAGRRDKRAAKWVLFWLGWERRMAVCQDHSFGAPGGRPVRVGGAAGEKFSPCNPEAFVVLLCLVWRGEG
jgi:hypothetical protein